MRTHLLLGITAILAAVLLFSSKEMLAQTKKSHTPPTYFEVVDEAFQFSKDVSLESKDVESTIVVRYLPSDGAPELQFVVLRDGTGRFRVIRYGLKKGTPSIQQQYNQAFAQKPTVSLEEILQKLAVEKTELKSKESVTRLLQQLPNLTISTKLSPGLCMDGMTYEIWIQTDYNKIHASLSDCAYGDKSASEPIMRWMKELRAEVQLK